MKHLTTLLLLSALLITAAVAPAMSSASYRLDWFTPLNTGAGGAMVSASYEANVTVGQTAIGGAASTSFGSEFGFWYAMLDWFKVYLPIVLRNHP